MLKFAILSLLVAAADSEWETAGIKCTVQPHLFECISNTVIIAVGTTLGIVLPIVIAIFVAGVLAIRRRSSNSSADAERGN